MTLVSDWILAKGPGAPVAEDFATRLRDSLEQRMRKFTSLALHHAVSDVPEYVARLIGFSARQVAQQVLRQDLQVEAAAIEIEDRKAVRSRSNSHSTDYRLAMAGGAVTLRVGEKALPWLGLLGIVGGGKSPDKGYGEVALNHLG